MDRSNAGKMSVPVGISSLTGARSISRSTAARWAARISRLWAASVSASGAPRQALPRCDGKGLERPHIQVARGRQKLILSRPYAHTPCHAGSLKAERQRRSAIGAKNLKRRIERKAGRKPQTHHVDHLGHLAKRHLRRTTRAEHALQPCYQGIGYRAGSRNNQQHLAFADPDDLVCVRTIEPRRDKHAERAQARRDPDQRS